MATRNNFYLILRRLTREANYSPPSNAEVKNMRGYRFTPRTSSWRGD